MIQFFGTELEISDMETGDASAIWEREASLSRIIDEMILDNVKTENRTAAWLNSQTMEYNLHPSMLYFFGLSVPSDILTRHQFVLPAFEC